MPRMPRQMKDSCLMFHRAGKQTQIYAPLMATSSGVMAFFISHLRTRDTANRVDKLYVVYLGHVLRGG